MGKRPPLWVYPVVALGLGALAIGLGWIRSRVPDPSDLEAASAGRSSGLNGKKPPVVPGKSGSASNGASPAQKPPGSTPARTPSAAASGSPGAPSSQVGFEEQFRAAFPGKWRFERTPEGVVHTVLGEDGSLIPKDSSVSQADSAASLARKIAAMQGVAADQLTGDPKSPPVNSGLDTAFRYQQDYQGYEVFGGRIAIHSRNSDGGAYIINTELKAVEALPPSPALRVADAERLIDGEILSRPDKPVIWAGAGLAREAPEFAWVFRVERAKPRLERLKVVVGATSGKVLLERSVLSR